MAEVIDRAIQTFRTNRTAQAILHGAAFFSVALVFGTAAGLISSRGNLPLTAIFAGLLVGLAVLSSRRALLWAVIYGGLVLSGVMQLYVPGSKYFRYLVPAAGSALLLHGILDYVAKGRLSRGASMSGIVFWALAFMGIAVVSSIVNLNRAGVIIMGAKGYFQMWPFLFAMILVAWRSEDLDSIAKTVLAIAIIQIPFAVHQYLFLMPQRLGLGSGVVAADIVSGTFGGNLFGGAPNAVLAAFMMIVIACVIGVWKRGVLSSGTAVFLVLVFVSPMFVNQAKVSFLYMLAVFLTLFRQEFVHRPLRFLGAAVVVIGVLSAMTTSFMLTNQSEDFSSSTELLDYIIDRQTADADDRRGYSELSRWTALTFWAEEHVSANPINTLIGHGPGASRVQDGGLDLAQTLAETRYAGLPLGYTALSAILWDTGVLGLFAVLAMFYSAFRTAGRISAYYEKTEPRRAGIYDGFQAGVVILVISLGHKDFFAFHLPYQTILVLLLGYLVVAQTRVQRQISSGSTSELRTL